METDGVEELSAAEQSRAPLVHERAISYTETPTFEGSVLVAVDASDISLKAFQFYIDTLHQEKFRVIVFSVVEPVCVSPVTGFGGSMSWRFDSWDTESISQWKKENDKNFVAAKQLQTSYAEKMKQSGIHGKVLLYHEHNVGHAIVHYAEKEKVNFIVVGSRGLSTVRRTLVGSHSDYVAHHAAVPVVIVPPEDRLKHAHGKGH